MENGAYKRLLGHQDDAFIVTIHIQQEIYPELWKTYAMMYIEIQHEIQLPILSQSNKRPPLAPKCSRGGIWVTWTKYIIGLFPSTFSESKAVIGF